jgi:hypothetical protein
LSCIGLSGLRTAFDLNQNKTKKPATKILADAVLIYWGIRPLYIYYETLSRFIATDISDLAEVAIGAQPPDAFM